MKEKRIKYKAMYKSELADLAGVSPAVFAKWLNELYYDELSDKFSYKKTDKILKPCVVKYLSEKLVIFID